MALQETLALFDFKTTGTDSLKKADSQVDKLTVGLKALGAILAVGFGAKGLFDFANGMADATDQTFKFAAAVGLTTREVAEWDMILGNAGVAQSQARLGLQTFTKKAGEAAKGNKLLKETFRDMGVAIKDARGELRPVNDVATDAVLGLSKIENQAERVATAQKLFGKAGLGFIRVALDGADALKAQREEFDDLMGGGSYEQYVEDSKAAAVAGDKFRNASNALKVALARTLIPVLTKVITTFAKIAKTFTRLINGTEIVKVTLVTLGTVAAAVALKILIAFSPIILTVLAVGAAIAGTILIIEDLYQLFTGGQSLIGKFLEKWLGFGKAQALIAAIKETFADMVDGVRSAGPTIVKVFQGVIKVLQKVLELVTKTVGKLIEVGEFLGETVSQVTGRTGGEQIARVRAQALAQQRQRQAEQAGFGRVLTEEERSERRQQALELSRGAALASSQNIAQAPAQALSQQAVNIGETTINIQGAGNPEETARLVAAQMEAQQTATLRRVREDLASR